MVNQIIPGLIPFKQKFFSKKQTKFAEILPFMILFLPQNTNTRIQSSANLVKKTFFPIVSEFAHLKVQRGYA